MEQDEKEKLAINGEENFAEMLEQSFVTSKPLQRGQKVKAKILKITPEWTFLDLGRKSEGYLATKELQDKDGTITVEQGEMIEAYFLPKEDQENLFTTRLGGGEMRQGYLEEAWRSGIPVEGLVDKEIKGGFEIKVAGNIRGFCPYSQMGLQRVDNPQVYIGERFSFKITEYAENGRNIILSNRAVLEEQQRRQRESLKTSLHEGMVVTGRITSIRGFGAFVDIGGVEGLIPISEIGWGRVEDVHEHLRVDQEVEIVIEKLDWEKDRFSFSLRKALPDPWKEVRSRFPIGSVHPGTVSRLTNFGAFITLLDGVDGLLHISKLRGDKRINHPREVLTVGQVLDVKIESIDEETKRLSLSMALAVSEEQSAEEDYKKYVGGTSSRSMGTLGDLLNSKLQNSRKR